MRNEGEAKRNDEVHEDKIKRYRMKYRERHIYLHINESLNRMNCQHCFVASVRFPALVVFTV